MPLPRTRRDSQPMLSRTGTQTVGQVYVVGYVNGLVKVGKSEDAQLRIRGLRTATFRPGLVAESWSAASHAAWNVNELRLLVFCHENYGEPALGRETFWGDYDATLAFALTLPIT
jgi:hypothetical protein